MLLPLTTISVFQIKNIYRSDNFRPAGFAFSVLPDLILNCHCGLDPQQDL